MSCPHRTVKFVVLVDADSFDKAKEQGEAALEFAFKHADFRATYEYHGAVDRLGCLIGECDAATD